MLAAAIMFATPSLAKAAETYGPKTINLIIGEAPGGGYDSYARLLARHIGRHIPGEPTIVAQNMPGAGSLNAANHIANVAARDGSVFGAVQRSVVMMPLLGMEGPSFTPDRLIPVGSMDQDVAVCIARRGAGIDSVEDLKTRGMVVGIEGRVSDINSFINPLTKMLGLRLKAVSGYNGAQPINLAIEHGEIDGRCGMSYSSLKRTTTLLQDGKVAILLQLALTKDPELPQVPLALDLVPDQEDREAFELLLASTSLARPFYLPPDVPPARVAMLRQAFDATMRDPDFRRDATQQNVIGRATGGAEMQTLIAHLYAMPPQVVARAKEMIQ